MFYEFNHPGSPDYFKIETGRDFNFPPHLHQCFEFITVTRGKMKVTLDGHEHTLCKGDALFIFPNRIHSLSSEESEHLLCIFSPHLVQAYFTATLSLLPENPFFRPDPFFVQRLAALSGSATAVEKKGILYLLCSEFDKSASYFRKGAEGEKILFKMFSFVEDEFRGDLSLSRLAEKTGYDYAYLSRCFKKAVGISFNEYVNRYRLSNACYLMENSERPIIECAFESGYTSLRSFNRNFKAYFGTTPAAYRRAKKL